MNDPRTINSLPNSLYGIWKNMIFLKRFSPTKSGLRLARQAANSGIISTGNITSENRKIPKARKVHIITELCLVGIIYPKIMPIRTNTVVTKNIARANWGNIENTSI